MKNRFEFFLNKLKEKEYKLTPQRKFILEVLLSNDQKHLSSEDVFKLVKNDFPELGLATVYRTLDLFAELGILQKMNFGDGKSRYELNEQNEHHHHHLICTNCGSVEEFEEDLLETIETVIKKKNDFLVFDHDLKFYGLCKNCK